jgi:FKBP-type peptidyl-prolyl cis-trans isomerase 2
MAIDFIAAGKAAAATASVIYGGKVAANALVARKIRKRPAWKSFEEKYLEEKKTMQAELDGAEKVVNEIKQRMASAAYNHKLEGLKLMAEEKAIMAQEKAKAKAEKAAQKTAKPAEAPAE